MCDGAEVCQSRVCLAGIPLNCDDGNPRTTDSCDRVIGCVHDILIAAHKLGLRSSFSKVSLKGTIVVSSPPTNGTAGDPVLHGGILRVVCGDGVQFDAASVVPPSNWSYIDRPGSNGGYRYRDPALALGPVWGVAIRDGRMSSR